MLDAIRSNLALDRGATVLGVSLQITAGGSAMEASFCKVESYQSLLELWFSLKSLTHRVKLDRDLVLNTVKRMFYVYLYAYSVSNVG
ncbi:hypothetical protein MP228_009059 [Amoeboaphelidium protococcarum]|nr:hypothetical protein MP228_009059 [Amoeboaphelidium protococcarum]